MSCISYPANVINGQVCLFVVCGLLLGNDSTGCCEREECRYLNLTLKTAKPDQSFFYNLVLIVNLINNN
jgi:hypothetical protein